MMRKKLVGQSIEAYLGAVSRHSRPGGVVMLHRTRACMLRTLAGWLASLGRELHLAIRCDSPKTSAKRLCPQYTALSCCAALQLA